MNPDLVSIINESSNQPPLGSDVTERLEHVNRTGNIIFFDVPPIELEDLYSYCKGMVLFGKDPTANNNLIQYYIISLLMGYLNTEFSSEISRPIDFSKKKKKKEGNHHLIPAGNGLSANISHKEGKRVEPIVNFHNAFEINYQEEREISLSYTSSIRHWKDIYTTRVKRGASKGKDHFEISKNKKASNRFSLMITSLKTFFPEYDFYSILFAYPREKFDSLEGSMFLVRLLEKYPQINLVLHDLSMDKLSELSAQLLDKYTKKHSPNIPSADDDPDRFITGYIKNRGWTRHEKNLVTSILKECKSHTKKLIANYDKDVVWHKNKDDYISLVGEIPPDFETQNKQYSYHYVNHLKPLAGIINKIRSQIKGSPKEKYFFLKIPKQRSFSAYNIMRSRIFPYNIIPFYLRELEQHIKGFQGNSVESLRIHMRSFPIDPEGFSKKQDYFLRGKRFDGSYESSRR
ncbi:hypothetical protein KY366_05650 [Candidatus Woesearchaeota archaeon]|nr:hypothetical protein [Candidatus Woesearchaeota archaeon]